MKKLLISVLFLALFTGMLFAHKVPMKWGKVTMDELKMGSYSYDPDAPAVVLCDYGTAEVGPRTEYTRHTRIKIFKKQGLNYTKIEIPYQSYDRFEVVVSVQAQTFNLSDKGEIVKTKLAAKFIEDIVIDSRNRKKIFTIPDVKPGSVVEYRYTIQSLDLVRLENWYFQSTIPTIHSEYWISVPRRFNYLITFQKGRALDINEQQSFAERLQWLYNTKLKKAQRELSPNKYLLYSSPRGSAKVYLSYGETMYFTMKDVPALKPGPDMVAFSDYYPTVKAHLYYLDRSLGLPFYYRTIIEASKTDYGSWNSSRLYYDQVTGYIIYWLPTWEEFNTRWLNDERLGKRLLKVSDLVVTSDTLNNGQSEKALAEKIYQKIKSEISWNGSYSMYAANESDKILKRKTGTSGEINMLLISALKRAGIDAAPVLVRTRNLGRIENMYPVNEQFNHIIAKANVDGKTYFIDASSSSDSFTKLPWTIKNANGWLLSKENYGWVEIMNTD